MRAKLAGAAAAVVVFSACAGSSDEDARATTARSAGASAPLRADGSAGITVVGFGQTTVEADSAYVGFGPGDYGPVSVSERDRRALLEALTAAGFPEEDIDIAVTTSFYSELPIRVRVDAASLPSSAEAIADVVEDVVGRSGNEGVQFAVSDCDAQIGSAREAAMRNARSRAEALGQAADVAVGELWRAEENVSPVFDGADPCDPSGAAQWAPYELEPFDADPAVVLSYSVTATYGVASAASSGVISATGSASVTVDADRATVVVISGDEFETNPRSAADDEQLVAAIEALEIRTEDIDIDDSFGPGMRLVAVHVAPADVSRLGEEIAEVVEDEVGPNQQVGVLFSTSQCEAQRVEAQRQAIAAAQGDLGALAEASGVELGDIAGVADAATDGGWFFYEPSVGDVELEGPCDPTAALATLDPYDGSERLKPLSAAPVAEISATVVLSRAIVGDGTGDTGNLQT